MSKYTRHKLRAHDRGEDRHNKGLSLIKKETRLARSHQGAVELAAVRRHKQEEALAAQRRIEKEQRRLEHEARMQANAEKRAARAERLAAKALAPVVWHPSALARELRKNQRLSPM